MWCRLSLLFFFIFGLAVPGMAQTQRTVTVQGLAKAKVTPDFAIIHLATVQRDKTMATAKRNADKGIEDATKALRAAGVEAERIVRSSLRINSYYPDENEEKPLEYVVIRTMSLTSKVEEVSGILDVALSSGLNSVEKIDYVVSDEVEIREKLLADAVQNAKEQATNLAIAFDSKLGKVLRIQADRNGGGGLSILTRGAQDSFDESGYSPDPVSILRTIDVVFELVD